MIANKDFSFDHHFPSYLWQQNGTSPGFETNPNWLLEAFCVLNASGTYAKYGISYLCYLLFILKKGGLPNLAISMGEWCYATRHFGWFWCWQFWYNPKCRWMIWVGFAHPNSRLMYGCNTTSAGFLGFGSEWVYCKNLNYFMPNFAHKHARFVSEEMHIEWKGFWQRTDRHWWSVGRMYEE